MRRIFLTLLAVFIVGLLLNLLWEQFHHVLYVHYKGGEITNFLLTRAAFFDAGFITVVFSPFVLVRSLKKYLWIPVFIALGFAIGLEQFALATARWAYTSAMPIIPLLGVGLSPTIQLAFTGYLSAFVGKKLNKRWYTEKYE